MQTSPPNRPPTGIRPSRETIAPGLQLNSLPVPAAVIDTDGLVLRAPNERLATLLGEPIGVLLGRKLSTMMQPLHLRRITHALALADATSVEVDVRLQRVDGTYVEVRCCLGALTPDTTKLAHAPSLIATFVGVASLTTSEVSVEDGHSVDELVHRLGHDLRHPLTVVAGYAQMLANGGVELDAATRDRVLTSLASAAVRAAEQVTSMLEGTHDRQDGDPTSVNLGDVAGWIEGLTALQFERVGGMLVIDIEDMIVPVDGVVLRQVLLNLVNNALVHARSDRHMTLHLSTQVVADGLELLVTDNGPGIPDELLGKVFEDGVRLDPAGTTGLGSGLAASRRLAERIGGMLSAVPYDGGARFVLWLPLAEDANTGTQLQRPRPQGVQLDERQRGSGQP